MQPNATKTLDCFPFYQVDAASWHAIKDKNLYNVWSSLEEHITRSIVTDDIELLQLICLDSKNKLIDSKIIAVGTVDHIQVKIRYIAEKALKSKVFGIIMAHNHTSGNTTPSWHDITYTKSLNHAFNLFDISLIDHLVVARNSVFSMRRHCLIF